MADHTHITSNETGSSGSSAGLAFILGAVVVVLGVVVWYMFEDNDDLTVGTENVSVTIEGGQSAAENAADAVSDAASGAASAVESAAEETEQAITGN